MPSKKTMMDYALAYARRGYAVFPCHPGVTDDPKSGKNPYLGKGGFRQATTDEGKVREWWTRWPDALIGCPPASKGMLVVDVDPLEGETCEWVVSELEKDLGEALPAAPTVITQSGGWHIWLRRVEGVELGNRKLVKRPGVDKKTGEEKLIGRVDARCDNGYVILPPSKMAFGTSYAWKDGADFEPPMMPDSLVEAIRKERSSVPASPPPKHKLAWSEDPGDKAVRRYGQGALDRACSEMAAQGKGGRGSALNSHAFSLGKLVGAGALSESEVTLGLSEAADACGLTATDGAKERDAKIRRGLDAGKADCGEVQQKLRRIAEEAREKAARYGQYGSSAPAYQPPAGPEDYGLDGRADHQTDAGDSSPASDGVGGDGVGPPSPPPSGPDPEKIKKCAGLDQNDTGNAQRLIIHFGNDVITVREHGFHQWAGTHWEMTGGEERIAIFAQRTAKLIEEEARFIAPETWEELAIKEAEGIKISEDMSDEDRKKVNAAKQARGTLSKRRAARRKYALSSGNNGKLTGMIKQAAPHITVGPEALDADGLAFNVKNGTLLFRHIDDEDDPSDSGPVRKKLDVQLVPHDRAMRISKCAPVTYNPDATCPKWMEFLERFQDEDRARFLQVYFGYALTGLTGEQKLIYMYGAGANGKSTMVEALCRLMGAYAGQLNPESVTGNGQRRGDQATPDLATLVGKRMVRVSELPKGQSVKEELIKGLTGGEPIQVRRLHQGFFDLVPIFKAVMSGNDMPYITGTDWGIWRRLLIVPWEVTISDAERRPMGEVLAEFDAERDGILNWLVEGLRIYISEGLRVPESVSTLTNSYKSEMDPIQNFIDACVRREEPDPKAEKPLFTVTGARMYEVYSAWCKASGVKAFSQTMLGRELPKKGIEKDLGRIRQYLNVQLTIPDEVTAIMNSSSHTHHEG
ncbi:phage/plasmid primase, P4 family [uncultured Cohaesibacter sp.]|uniref:phage/plasmid primase, P4 family n=1 Tax=uncultured Cohaesibacter sp. TaxID=1002546 RepID=UPI0029C7EA14|nr:phage/plasmid primase, P4 family [uncultured Cohaesibacter sp.]